MTHAASDRTTTNTNTIGRVRDVGEEADETAELVVAGCRSKGLQRWA